jgi:outer membrane protein OmpA-like peptidoglycan-associated protein
MKHILLLVLFTIGWSNIGLAQDKDYTDHKPQYRKWLDSYIIDKIEYTKTNTVMYFRFVCDNTSSGGATFYPPGGESPWYLKGRTVRKDFDITAVKNIRRNGILVKGNVVGEAFHTEPLGKTGHTVFSCEVHFPRLPSDLKEADLIEGRGQEYNRRHFNCFNIKLKTWEDDLGSEDDSKKVVEDFEKKYNTTTTKPPEEKKTEEKKPTPPKKQGSGKLISLEKLQDIDCGERLVLDKVQFHDNSTKYKGMIEANRTLGYLFTYMRENPNTVVTLHGYSDIFGDKERNLELSKARVLKIQRWLTMYGIKARRINYEAHGSADPLVAEGDVSNRRVEVEIECRQ